MRRSFPILLPATMLLAALLQGCTEREAAADGRPTSRSVTEASPATGAVVPAGSLRFETKPSGVRVAVLYGDPKKPGPFGLRLRYPPGYAKGPHYHPKDAFVTVLSGSYYRAYGTSSDRSKGIHLVAGTFSVNPARVGHYEWVEEPAELEVHAEGPWGTVYVDAAGEPAPGDSDACGGDVCEGHGPALSPEARRPVVLPPGDQEFTRRQDGREVAVLFGDPMEPGPFVLRMRLAGGTREEPHVHPQDAIVTVLSGSLRFGVGNAFVESDARPVAPLDLLRVPADLPHFVANDSPTLVEVHATGPWGATAVAH